MIGNTSNRIEKLSNTAFAYLLSSPFILLVCVGLFSFVATLLLSFTDYRPNVAGVIRFVGFRNIINLFNDPVFKNGMELTIYFTVVSVIVIIIGGLIMANILRLDFIGKKVFLVIFLIPWAIPRVSNGIMFKWMFNGEMGIINYILRYFSIIDGPKYWFHESPINALNIVILAEAWKNVPYIALLILAKLVNIPKSLYEAAICDSANAIQRFFYITYPSIKPILVIVLILQTMWSLKTFDLIHTITRGGPGNRTMLVYLYAFQQAFNYMNIGYASSIGYLLAVLIFVLTICYTYILKTEDI